MPELLARLAIQNSELFADWPEQALALLLLHAEVIHLEPGACLHQADDEAPYLYLVASGALALRRTMATGRELTVRIYLAGAFHGLGPVMSQTPYKHTAIGKEKSVLVRIPGQVVRDLVGANGRLSFSLFAALEGRHLRAVRRYGNASMHSVRARIAEHLLLMDPSEGRQHAEREIVLSQEEIAAMLGTGRQVVNRGLQEMAKAGVVEIRYGRILIVDRERLLRMADDLD